MADISIKNRKASFEYSFLEKYTAGLQLRGTEIKSIREGKANINDAYCAIHNDELWIRNMHINEYEKGGFTNHAPNRERKLLLNKHELNKIQDALKDKGLTVIPLHLFINKNGWAKLEIAIAKGKKIYDKREDIKKRDLERETGRRFK